MKLTDKKIKELEEALKKAEEQGNMHEVRVLMDAIWEHKQVLLNNMREVGLLSV